MTRHRQRELLVCVENPPWTQNLAWAEDKASQAFLLIMKALAFVFPLISRGAFSLVRGNHPTTFIHQILPCARHDRMHFINLLI